MTTSRWAICCLCRWMLGLAVLLCAAASGAYEGALEQTTRAEFRPASDAAWQPVALPDTWAQRRLPTHGSGQYRLTFQLAGPPRAPWALRLSRVSSSRRVLLNGHLVQDENALGRNNPVPDLIELPTTLLRPGTNEIVLELSYRVRGGLSAAEFGPAGLLRAQHDSELVWTRELPRSLNMGMAVLGAIMLIVCWRRPSERALGLFGALGLIGSVRNYTYFAQVTLLPPTMTDWLFFIAQVWTVVLFSAYARSLAHAHEAPRLRGIHRAVLVLPVAIALLAPWPWLPMLRTLAYPLLLLAAMLAVRNVWRAARRRDGWAHYVLVASLGLCVLSGAHDYAFQQGHLPLTGTFWLPFVMPIALVVYSMMLFGRLITAMGEAETLNASLESRVAERTHELEVAHAAKTRFLASASHDLRQPVVAIGLLVGLVRERVVAPDVRAMIDRVDEAVASMEALLKGLLDLSRLESGAVKLRLQPVPLQALFDAIESHAGPAARAKGLRLRFRGSALAAYADPLLLEQMLRNLVTNAVSYTDRGGVLVAARQRGRNGLRLQVLDSGRGIAAEHHEAVFDEFVQLENPARERSKGLGLGLAIVKRCALLLACRVSLRSTPGRGSCFSIDLPLATIAPVPARTGRGAGEALAGCTLLLLEDDAEVRGALAARLRAWGAQLGALSSLAELHAWLHDRRGDGHADAPDLLITDHRLPDGNGLQAIAATREQWPRMAALVITGDTDPQDFGRLIDSGVPVLHKPFRAEALLQAIRKAWGQSPLSTY